MAERALTDAEQEELDGLFSLALGYLPVSSQANPAFLIGALHLLIEEFRAGRLREVPPDDLAAYGGVVWGDELCRLQGWQWCYLTLDSGLEGAAVVTPDRSLAVMPVHMVYRWLSRPQAPNECQPLFDRMSRPPEQAPAPGGYLLVG